MLHRPRFEDELIVRVQRRVLIDPPAAKPKFSIATGSQ
jgi:hypothetical protein